MSLKSVPLSVSKEKPQESTQQPSDVSTNETKSAIVLQKPNCWCVGRNYKLHQVGDPFCHFSGTYKPPVISSMSRSDEAAHSVPVTDFPICSIGVTKSPVTFDEDLLTSCINRAVMKTPSEFVSLLDEGRVNPSQARLINNELRAMGYCIAEEPF